MDTTSNTEALGPPAYSPAIDTPHYTAEPSADEERLQINGRLPAVRERTGVFVERAKHVTLALTNQVPNCKEPTYGRGALIQGAISPTRLEGIVSVEVKLEAILEVIMTSVVISGETVYPLFSKRQVLFGNPESIPDSLRASFTLSRKAPRPRTSAPNVEEERCPSTLPFSIRLPNVYSHEGVSRELPPSYKDHFSGIPGLDLDSRYTLSIIIGRKGPLVKDKKTVLMQAINFMPRSRPAQPALPSSLSFISTLKSSPEEWKAFEEESAVREGHRDVAVLRSALLLPRSQIYPINHTIPFHLQLSCCSEKTLSQFENISDVASKNPSSLALLSASSQSTQSSPLRFSQQPSKSSRKGKDNLARSYASNALDTMESGRFFDAKPQAATEAYAVKNSAHIYLSIQRHVAVQVMGEWLQLKKTMGTSTFERCPLRDAIPMQSRNTSLAWEGHIHVSDESKCGGFGAPGVRVKDHILLSVIPADSDHAPLQEIHHLIPIRLTTDAYSEEALMPDVELARQSH